MSRCRIHIYEFTDEQFYGREVGVRHVHCSMVDDGAVCPVSILAALENSWSAGKPRGEGFYRFTVLSQLHGFASFSTPVDDVDVAFSRLPELADYLWKQLSGNLRLAQN